MYQHSPLSYDDEIRLLHLEPGSADDAVRFTLHPARLSDRPSYEAISYCWGDEKDTQEAYCEGQPLRITTSLYTALRRFRTRDTARVLWADAVCINQADVPEKNTQVRLMSRIYSQPTRVLIWLGEDKSGLDGLHESIEGALALLPPEHYDFESIYRASRTAFVNDHSQRRNGKPNFLDHNWGPITSLLHRPWFGRRWVIQEVTLADDSVPRLAACGDVEFSWTSLASVAYRLAAYGIVPMLAGVSTLSSSNTPSAMLFLSEGGKPLQMLLAACMTYLIKSYRQTGNLVDAVTATPSFKCTDARDHLYSLLSLMRDSKSLQADYALSPEEVCRRFAVTTLVADQNLRILSLAPHTALVVPGLPPPARLALPSWVPDLTCQGMVNPLVSYTIRPQLFHAGGGKGEKPNASISPDGRLLHVRGRVVDKVAAMASCLIGMPFPTEEEIRPKSGFPARAKKRMVNWLRECRSVAGEKYYRGGEEDAESRRGFFQTLVCGMTGLRDPLPEEVLGAMETYVDYLFGFFTEGFTLSEEVRMIMLTYGVLVEQALIGMSESRHFCRTEQGRLGQVRAEARAGDVLVCIVGAEVPYLLRPSSESEGVYTLVGDAFLLGVMQGEVWSDERYQTVDIAIE